MQNNGENLQYSESNIQTLDWREHIRLRPGMYIGKLGDGTSSDDGIYLLLKEIIDNSIDEFRMKCCKKIIINITENKVSVRDFGRGIPLGSVVNAVSKMNTSGRFDERVFKKSIGLNGVGTKAVNALSQSFQVKSFRKGMVKNVFFEKGILKNDFPETETTEKDGTYVEFLPDSEVFPNFKFRNEFAEKMVRFYVCLNSGLEIIFNDKKFISEDGLKDLLEQEIGGSFLFPIIDFKSENIEIVFTFLENNNSETYFSFVNGQHTTQGGTHLNAFKEVFVKVIREFFKKNFDSADIRKSLVAGVYLHISSPVFESQTKIKLGSTEMTPGGISIKSYVADFMKNKLDNFLHQKPEIAQIILEKIQKAENLRKQMSEIQSNTRKRKTPIIHNHKLRDCREHFNDKKSARRWQTQIFITEGNSATGTITQTRDVETQAVFTLRGKPMNVFHEPIEKVLKNEELKLLQLALDIDDDISTLRYNQVIIATDADVDGMHIRLLLITFFLLFYPKLVENGHLYILQTPLFRVRNKKETRYCYSENDKIKAISELGKKSEITRFKGLGEISKEEFRYFIGEDIRLEKIISEDEDKIKTMLEFYMGHNTPERRNFILENLVIDN